MKVSIRKQLGEFTLHHSFKHTSGVLGLLGESGCGKTMTLRCIAGIVRPDEGHIQLGNTLCFDNARKVDLPPQKRRVGMLFQSYALFPNMTVRENIRSGLPRGMGKQEEQKQLDALLEQFHLTEVQALRPHQLSGGQQQRCALARCLAADPKALLLDEPFSALDGNLKRELQLQLKQQLSAFLGPVVLVTHDREEACFLCDRVALMHNGTILRQGETREVFADPRSITAARITGCENILPARKAGEFALTLTDWNITLHTELPVPDETSAVGIRAQAIRAGRGENALDLSVAAWHPRPVGGRAVLQFPGAQGQLLWDSLESAPTGQVYIPKEQVLPLMK